MSCGEERLGGVEGVGRAKVAMEMNGWELMRGVAVNLTLSGVSGCRGSATNN